MTETELKTENNTKDIKLYSSKAISGATFLGGPLAAGYLIGENFKALNKPDEGRKSLIFGIITTIILFGGMFMLPEKIIDQIPRQLIPLIYTGIIWGIVEWTQGEPLKAHKEYGNSFFSGWKAAGIGLISLLIVGIGIFGYTYLSTDSEVYEKYNKEFAKFSKNETETLVFYSNLNSGTKHSLLKELDEKTIPRWKENIEIINKTNRFEDLPSELIKQNEVLIKYSELRIQAFELFRKGINEDTDKYIPELKQIHLQIDNELKKLN
ncbi:hypothetical protein [Aestuariivivens insulae]|uniref:hypothetical protein n=1 Tax=Aestuariivivens insulae TaxID=1621988 RepID=UPI001F59681A|nr:hypothetical protein [Aestuariivivens insulae]